MKLSIKTFRNGAKVRIEGCDGKQVAALERKLRAWLKCEETTVVAFDEPLPECGPGEKNC